MEATGGAAGSRKPDRTVWVVDSTVCLTATQAPFLGWVWFAFAPRYALTHLGEGRGGRPDGQWTNGLAGGGRQARGGWREYRVHRYCRFGRRCFEPAVLASVEDQRPVRFENVESKDPADHDHVVASQVLRFDRAFQPAEPAFDDGMAGASAGWRHGREAEPSLPGWLACPAARGRVRPRCRPAGTQGRGCTRK